MIDSHTHLGSCRRPAAELVAEAEAAGVTRLLTIGMDAESNRQAVALAEAHPGVYAAVGRHPNAATGYDDEAAAQIEQLSRHDRVRAIGETGLDWYRDHASPDDQRAAFVSQIELARAAGLPLVIHMRASIDDTVAMLRERADGVTVILHCYSGSPALVDEVPTAWYVSFAGNVTYPSAGELREAAARVDPERLLVETDAPYLAPQPVRGRPNEPACVIHTAAAVAEARGVDAAELEAQVEANARRLFGW